MDGTVTPARANPDVNRGAKRRGPRAEKPLSLSEIRILAVLRGGPHDARTLADAARVGIKSIHVVVNRLMAKGLVRRQAPGWYEIAPLKPIGVKAIAAVAAPPAPQAPQAPPPPEPSIIRPIPLSRLMGGR